MSNFVERLLQRSQNSRRISELKLALTPEMVPEIFVLPIQNKVNNRITPLKETKQLPMFTEQELSAKDIMNSKTQPSDSLPPSSSSQTEIMNSKTQPSDSLPPSSSSQTEIMNSKTQPSDSLPSIPPSSSHKIYTSETMESMQDGSVKSNTQSNTINQSEVADIKKNSIVSKPEIDFPDSPQTPNPNSSHGVRQKGTLFYNINREQTKQGRKQLEETPESGKIISNRSEQSPFSESFENTKNNLIKNQTIQQKASANQYQTKPKHLPSESSVVINIGKIEVRAIVSDKKSITPKETKPILSLEEYLKQRRSGSF